MKEKEEENNDKKIKDLIDDNIEENEKKLDENRISNGLSDSQNNNISNISEKEEEFKPKKKYIPRNEQEALKAKIINLELKEKPNNNDIYQDYNHKIHENIDIGIRYTKEKFKIPKELKKTFIIVLILAILGITLIICGFIKAISDATPGGGIMFWVLGTVVIIPGGFYSYQFYKAKKAKEEYRRQDILDNIPQL
jgi:hypothetical protein